MTEPTPESDNWQDFYKNPPPPPPPQSKPVNVKRIAGFAVAVPLVAVLVGLLISWARTPSEPTPPAAKPPAVEVPPVLIDKLLSPSPTAPARKVTIAAPEKLGGRAKATDPALLKIASDTQIRMNGLSGTTSVASAYYGSHAKKNLVLLVAIGTQATARTSTGTPAEFLTTLLTDPTIKIVTQPGATDAGPLGGSAACGEVTVQGVQTAGCAWSDEGSIAGIIWYYTSLAKAQKEFHALRAEIETIS